MFKKVRLSDKKQLKWRFRNEQQINDSAESEKSSGPGALIGN